MTVLNRLADDPTRCTHGYHPTQRSFHDCPGLKPTGPADEWTTFRRALLAAVRDDATVHPCDVRPLVRGVIPPRTISRLYQRARNERLLVEAGHERSDDVAGRNGHRLEPYFTLRSAA